MKEGIKQLLLLVLVTFLSMPDSLAQVKELIVYKTYADYKNDSGVLYEDNYKISMLGHAPGKDKFFIIFKKRDKRDKENKKVKLKLKEIWGFKYNDYLFRTHEKNSTPHYVFSEGKIIYYENGAEALHQISKHGFIRDNRDIVINLKFGEVSHVSIDLNSKLYKFSTEEQIKKVVKAYPVIYTDLADCILSYKQLNFFKKIRDCIRSYNE